LATKIANKNKEVGKLYDKFSLFAKEVAEYTARNENINWGNIQKVKSVNIEVSYFLKLNYDNYGFVNKLEELLNNIRNYNMEIENFIIKQNTVIQRIQKSEYLSPAYKNNTKNKNLVI
jgi:hypothetical protein